MKSSLKITFAEEKKGEVKKHISQLKEEVFTDWVSKVISNNFAKYFGYKPNPIYVKIITKGVCNALNTL